MIDARAILKNAVEQFVEEASLEFIDFLEPELDAFDDALMALLRKMCLRLGHKPMNDHCGRPEHRFCKWCGALTPG